MPKTIPGVDVREQAIAQQEHVLIPEALEFVTRLHRKFNSRRLELLEKREERQKAFDAGQLPGFLEETRHIRESAWQVAPAPKDLDDRRVEITGPVDRKMMINALNSGAKVFMADFEDSLAPSWENIVNGQFNARDAVRRIINLEDTTRGKSYWLNEEIATLVIRPRGWHLVEKNVKVDGEPISASLFDFGLYMYHNAQELLARGSGPYFYLPKLENHLEARLWNDVFVFAQEQVGIPQGSVRATVLIETILAAFEMEEILYELRDHMAGLNAGRWDYIFSFIKKLRRHGDKTLPERAQVTMTVPFMQAYAELLVKTCHRRGAHAIGGMAAFIPSKDPEVNETAFVQVKRDKTREANQGYDGTWVAHPGLISAAMEAFDAVLSDKSNQKDNKRDDLAVSESDLLNTNFSGSITEAGVRMNIDVALQYLNAWLNGDGAAAIYNLMEDAATAEISRAQLWQWIENQAKRDDDQIITREMYQHIRNEELTRLKTENGDSRFGEAAEILDALLLTEDFVPFLTLIAYRYID